MQELTEKTDQEAVRIIEAMGGPTVLAEMFEISVAAVSQWRFGIPSARMMTIKLMRPDLFEKAA